MTDSALFWYVVKGIKQTR